MRVQVKEKIDRVLALVRLTGLSVDKRETSAAL